MRERADWNINNIYPAVFITGDTAVPGTAVDQEQEDDEEDDGWIKTVSPLGLHWSPAEWSTAVIRDQVRDHDVNTPALLCHKESAPIIGPFRAWKPTIPYAIKNQRL